MATRTTHPVPDGTTVGQRPALGVLGDPGYRAADTSDDGLDIVVEHTYSDGATGFGWKPVGTVISTGGSSATFNPAPLTARVTALENAPGADLTPITNRLDTLEADEVVTAFGSTTERDASVIDYEGSIVVIATGGAGTWYRRDGSAWTPIDAAVGLASIRFAQSTLPMATVAAALAGLDRSVPFANAIRGLNP